MKQKEAIEQAKKAREITTRYLKQTLREYKLNSKLTYVIILLIFNFNKKNEKQKK